MAADLYNKTQPSATGDKPPFPMSRPASSRCRFTARGDWAILTTTVHDALDRLQLDRVGLFECQSALPSSRLPFSAFLLLAESSDHSVCLPSQVTVFLLRQAGTVPGLSLRFVNFCLVHLETNRREYTQV